MASAMCGNSRPERLRGRPVWRDRRGSRLAPHLDAFPRGRRILLAAVSPHAQPARVVAARR